MAANWVNEQEIAGIRFRVTDKLYIGIVANKKAGNMAFEIAEALATEGSPLEQFLKSDPVKKVQLDMVLRKQDELGHKDAAIGLAMNEYTNRYADVVKKGLMTSNDVEALARKNWKEFVGQLM